MSDSDVCRGLMKWVEICTGDSVESKALMIEGKALMKILASV